jgi:hypothetical protein
MFLSMPEKLFSRVSYCIGGSTLMALLVMAVLLATLLLVCLSAKSKLCQCFQHQRQHLRQLELCRSKLRGRILQLQRFAPWRKYFRQQHCQRLLAVLMQ